LAAITLNVIVVGIDQTVLSVDLSTLANALHATTAELQCSLCRFSLALCASLLPAGLLGDRYGRKRMLLVSLATFGAGSLLCAHSPSPGVLIAARVVLGIGAAFLIPLSMSVLPVLFNEQERRRAVGIWAAANFLALPVGPIPGGWLLTKLWWGSVFLINVPASILAIVAVVFLLPESRSEKRPGLDPLGVALSSSGMVAIIYGVIDAGENGWGTVSALVPMAAGALLLVLIVLWEARLGSRPRGQPLIDLSLFRSRRFTWGTLLSALAAFAMSGMLFTLPQYSQAILNADAMTAGVQLLPVVGGLLVGAMAANRLSARAGAKITAAAGAMNALPADRSGVGSAVMQAVQKVGAPFGAAVLGSVFSSVYQGRLVLTGVPDRLAAPVQRSAFAGVTVAQQLRSNALLQSVRGAFMAGMDHMLLVCGIVTAASIALTLIFLPGRAEAVEAGQAIAPSLREESRNG
jgi:EmrB/QacA subfamily drug resistance transporter